MATGALLAFATEPANARRLPTVAEASAIRKVMGPCQRVYISTVSSNYASSEYRDSKRCRKYASNGIGILRKRDGRWRYLTGMSDCTSTTLPGVPTRVYRDLTDRFCEVS